MTPEERKRGEDVWLRASLMSAHEQQIEIVGDALRAAFNAGLEAAKGIVDKRTDLWRGKDGDCAMSLEEECEDISAAIDRARLSQKEET